MKIRPVLIVDEVAASLALLVDRKGFVKVALVPARSVSAAFQLSRARRGRNSPLNRNAAHATSATGC